MEEVDFKTSVLILDKMIDQSGEIQIKTLGARKEIIVFNVTSERIQFKQGPDSNICSIDKLIWDSVSSRASSLDHNDRVMSSQYGPNKWKECPNALIAPYCAAIYLYLENLD